MTRSLVLSEAAAQIVNPRTGEALDLREASTTDLADARDALTALYRERQLAAQMVDEEIIRRTDEAIRTGDIDKYTFDVGEWRVQVDTGHARTYDSNRLRQELLRLAHIGEISLEERAVERLFGVRQYYVKMSDLDDRAGRDPKLAQVAERFLRRVRRTVKAERLVPRADAEGTAEDEGDGR